MQLNSFIQSKLAGLLSYRSSSRKYLVVVLIFLLLLYFFIPHLKSSSRRYIVLGRVERCVEDKLKPFVDKVSSKNAFLYHNFPFKAENDGDDVTEKYFLPYVGNGYIGIATDGNHGVWLKGKRGLDIATDFNPLVKFEIAGFNSKGAVALDISEGRITNLTCYQHSSKSMSTCITMTQMFYVHRTRPGVLVQDVNIYNPSDENIEVTVIQDSLSQWATEYSPITEVKNDKDDVIDSSEWSTGSKTLEGQVHLTVASRQFSQSGILALPAKKSVRRRCITMFDYTILDSPGSSTVIPERRKHTVKALLSTISLSEDKLNQEHLSAWHEIWKSGFGISESKAPDALNADVINSTLYYIVSHVPSILQDVTSEQSNKSIATTNLNHPDTCYHNRHHTLQFSSLWQIGDTVETMNKGVDTHLNSLEKYGCSNYIKAGAEGVLQAVLLSLGGLSFVAVKDDVLHMEFNVDPADLHRDYQFRNIRYADKTYLNLSVIVDESNYAVLYVSSTSTSNPFYASDAGLSEPVKLSAKSISLPVKLTKPLTSILYVSNDKHHLLDMRKVVQHVEVPVLAPAHDHRLIAMHKHGHSYGGLPVIFWILLVILLLVFHFFLFKMVFNEFCRGDSGTYYRRRAFS